MTSESADDLSNKDAQNELVRFLHHELMTPTFVFKNMVRMLMAGKTPTDKQLKAMMQECIRYEGLVNRVMEFKDAPITVDRLKAWRDESRL